MRTKQLAATILLSSTLALAGCEINNTGGPTTSSQPLPGEPAYGSDYGPSRGGYNKGGGYDRDRSGYGRDDHNHNHDHRNDKGNRGGYGRNNNNDSRDNHSSRVNHSSKDKSDHATNDAQFIYMAGQDSLGIVVLSRMAAQKATSPKVKAFAAELLKEHDEMNHRIVYLAKQRSYKVSTELTGPQVRQFQAMQKMPAGKDFDHTYLDALNDNFAGGVGPYRDAARASSDREIVQFADRHMGMVRDHQRRSRELAKDLSK